jgi:hypothetical protein
VSDNPLVAAARSSTIWYTGLGLAEDAAQISNGIHDNSWVDGTLGGVGGSLDVLGLVIDPLGSLVAWGVSWLMEHVRPLKEALDWLASGSAGSSSSPSSSNSASTSRACAASVGTSVARCHAGSADSPRPATTSTATIRCAGGAVAAASSNSAAALLISRSANHGPACCHTTSPGSVASRSRTAVAGSSGDSRGGHSSIDLSGRPPEAARGELLAAERRPTVSGSGGRRTILQVSPSPESGRRRRLLQRLRAAADLRGVGAVR